MQEQAIGPAPAVTLKAIGHGRKLPLNAMGVTTMIICLARETSDKASGVVTPVRERWPLASEVTIINMADGRPFPKLIRKIAEQIMKSSYNNAVENLQEGRTPEEYVLIAPDWDGSVLKPLGLEDLTKEIAVAVINMQGDLVGVYQGDDCAAQAIAMIERAGP
jgi:hypothetical protein